MADKDTTETVGVEPGRYEEPREKADEGHKDAGQVYVERHREHEPDSQENVDEESKPSK